MVQSFLVLSVAALAILSGTCCFQFQITRNLETAQKLEKENWIYVEVAESNLPENDVSIFVKAPLSLQISDISVFFANDSKKILQVSLNKILRGKFFAVPYQLVNELNGQNINIKKEDQFQEISGTFPRKWLPENCTRINAAVTSSEGHIYNVYEIKNFKISIPDLLLVEEYEKYFPSVSSVNTM